MRCGVGQRRRALPLRLLQPVLNLHYPVLSVSKHGRW
jgi:hypothetical protein